MNWLQNKTEQYFISIRKMTTGLNNDDIIESSQDYIKSRYKFLDQQEKELADELTKGKEKEKELADKLLALKKRMEVLSGGKIKFDTKTEEVKPVAEEMNIEPVIQVVKPETTEKIDEIASQKLVEIVDLTEKEEETIQKKFGNKSLKETEKIINKERNNPRMKKIFNKIRKTVLVLGIAWGLSLAIYQYAIYDAKKRANEKVEEAIKSNPQDSIPTLPTRIIITTDTLKKHIRQEQLAPWISYDSIASIINNINNDELREQVIECFKNGNVIEAQEIFGMKRNSQYTSNKAAGRMDKNTLNRFSDIYFNLYGKDILDNKEIPQDVKVAYQKFLLGEIKNNDANYIIISKIDFHLYLFTKDHKLLNRQVVLLGEDIGKEWERVPYKYYKTNKGVVYHNKEVNTNTPEWLFIIKQTYQLTDKYISDGPKTALALIPINSKTYKTDNTKYEINKYVLEIHPIYQQPTDPTAYQEAIASGEIDDNAISHGCVNIAKDGIVKDNITIGKSVVYITDDKTTSEE